MKERQEMVVPDRNKHRYVIGIDFGHGETSACVTEIDWTATAGTSKMDISDVIFDDNGHKVIVSAIATLDGNQFAKGEEVFKIDAPSNYKFKINFKKPPVDICGEDETLMIEYMKIIYNIIRERKPELEDDNHIVYIARPADNAWIKVKELYKKMVLNANIPLAGLTSESRAAIFFAIQKSYFAKNISNGIMVFDLGSSTLDFTYYNARNGEVIDGGDSIGGAEVDKVIFDKILEESGIREFVQHHPDYEQQILFKARKIKEEIYSYPQYARPYTLSLADFVRRNWPDYSLYNKVTTTIYENAQELTDLLEMKIHYYSRMRTALINFRDEKIKERSLNGVILVGGASAMNFIEPLIRECYDLSKEQVRRDPEPSLTVSRGIALLGKADCISIVLQKELKAKAFPIDKSRIKKKYIGRPGRVEGIVYGNLPLKFADAIWNWIYSEMYFFRFYGQDMSIYDLEFNIKRKITENTDALKLMASNALKDVLESELEQIRKELNEIINIYLPGGEIQKINTQLNINIDNKLNFNQVIDPIISKCIDAIKQQLIDNVKKALWVALGVFLWGIFSLVYYAGKALYLKFIKSEAEKELEKRKMEEEMKKKPLDRSMREKAYNEVINMQPVIKREMKSLIYSQLISDPMFCTLIEIQSEKYLEEIVYQNIERVKIKIE